MGFTAARVSGATVTSTADSATVVTLAAAKATRAGLWIQNSSTEILFVKMGDTATVADYSVEIPARTATGATLWEMPTTPIYTGIVTGIWANNSTGAAKVTEF